MSVLRYRKSKFNQSGYTLVSPIRKQYVLSNRKAPLWPFTLVLFQFGAPSAEILAVENLVCAVIQNPQSQTSLLLEFWGVQLGGTLAWSISMCWPMERLPSSSPLLSDLVYKVCSWDFKNWPISRNPGSTNSVVCVGQKGGSTVVHPFFWILILRSVGWDIGCQSLTYPEALWLNQSGGSMFLPNRVLPSDHIL